MTGSDPRRGMVLLIVLWTIALCSALAMATSVSFRSFAGIGAVDRDRTQSDALLTAGLEVAAGLATEWPDKPLLERETVFELSTGTVRANFNDEGGYIDIGKASPDLLAALLHSVGASQSQADSVAQSIVAWRRRNEDQPANNNPTNNNPTNNNAANGANASASTNNAPNVFLTDVSQIAQVPGMRPEWAAAIRPLTTVFGAETVNPLTAPAGVIASLPGVDSDRLAAFLAARRNFPNDAARLNEILGQAQRFVAAKPQQAVSVQIAAMLGDGYAAAARAVIVVLPHDSQPYRVLVWTPLSPSTVL
jgi:general secretion pathway protein K